MLKTGRLRVSNDPTITHFKEVCMLSNYVRAREWYSKAVHVYNTLYKHIVKLQSVRINVFLENFLLAA